MAKVKWPGGALLAPVPPVLVTTGTLTSPNICTVAWCGILNTKPPTTYISLRPSRYSYELIQKNPEFVINLPTASLVRSIDYCGVRSGRKQNKFADCGLSVTAAETVEPPLLEQSPVCIECRVTQTIPLGSHDMLIAEILAVQVEQNLIDSSGKLHLDKAGLAAYAHGEYFALGKKIGSFGYSVRKRKKTTVKPQRSKPKANKSTR